MNENYIGGKHFEKNRKTGALAPVPGRGGGT
ncbi:MAG TPA: hypothetical protein DEA60_04125 [Thermotoga naphthophila]|uniref:Uncharacterized protein n=1 Tax=Thermotoga maritima (strain ATCC 43589 / DSM 3109 / JCM 10099 / NBRC 100826 / MSB8) TaxID=243274 RepID=Q9X0W9_THEMA|nr:hypothetical protein TM_1242 [Thermotoga maritima MSB8]HBU00248.1 hypothetical protein [Thermotoga petrophila]